MATRFNIERLPQEIQDAIWSEAILEKPGVHCVDLVTRPSTSTLYNSAEVVSLTGSRRLATTNYPPASTTIDDWFENPTTVSNPAITDLVSTFVVTARISHACPTARRVVAREHNEPTRVRLPIGQQSGWGISIDVEEDLLYMNRNHSRGCWIDPYSHDLPLKEALIGAAFPPLRNLKYVGFRSPVFDDNVPRLPNGGPDFHLPIFRDMLYVLCHFPHLNTVYFWNPKITLLPGATPSGRVFHGNGVDVYEVDITDTGTWQIPKVFEEYILFYRMSFLSLTSIVRWYHHAIAIDLIPPDDLPSWWINPEPRSGPLRVMGLATVRL